MKTLHLRSARSKYTTRLRVACGSRGGVARRCTASHRFCRQATEWRAQAKSPVGGLDRLRLFYFCVRQLEPEARATPDGALDANLLAVGV